MRDYWVRFAKTGDPNGDGAPIWASMTAASAHYMVLDANAHIADATPRESKVQSAGVAAATRIWGPAQ